MAQIVFGSGCSHGPSIQKPAESWATLAEKDPRDPRFDYRALLAERTHENLAAELDVAVQQRRSAALLAALAEATRRIAALRPDVVLIVSNAHEIHRDEPRPVFALLRGEAFAVAEATGATFETAALATATGAMARPGHPALADHLIEALNARDFDIGCIDGLRDGRPLDEAFSFCYKYLLGGAAVPMVPLYLSRDLPNQASPGRCIALGRALGQAIADCPLDLRVGVIASGGLSHQIVDEELDRRVIAGLSHGALDTLDDLPRARLNRAPGTPEILNWLVVGGAMAPAPMELLSYEPCYRSLAGTGQGAAVGYWQP